MSAIYFISGLMLVLIGTILILVSTKPDQFFVERSGVMNAAPEKIFPHINTMKLWQDWSPWAKMDPNCKISYEGPEAGIGNAHIWDGNDKVGCGKLTIIESDPHKHIGMNLEFTRPFKCNNKVDFDLIPEGNMTKVIWKMNGKNNFMGKLMCIFMDMDKMVGSDYEKGLASLKKIVEQ
jgi:hypothetical protein